MNKFEAIVNLVNALARDLDGRYEAVRLYNRVAYEVYGDEIYFMSDFDDVCDCLTPREVANMVKFGHYNPLDDFFRITNISHMKTVDSPSTQNNTEEIAIETIGFPSAWIDAEEIAKWCIQGDDLDNEEIAAILEQ